MIRFLTIVALACAVASPSHAALKFVGQGSAMTFDTSRFPAPMKANFEIMKDKCTRCHSLERIVIALSTGVAPVSGRPFDVEVMKVTTFNMLRKAGAKNIVITKDEAKSISSLLKFLIDESVR